MGLLELEVFCELLPLHWARGPSHCFPIAFTKLYHKAAYIICGLCFCPPCRWCSIHSYSNPHCSKLVPWIIYQMPVKILLKAMTVEGATVVVHEPFMRCDATSQNSWPADIEWEGWEWFTSGGSNCVMAFINKNSWFTLKKRGLRCFTTFWQNSVLQVLLTTATMRRGLHFLSTQLEVLHPLPTQILIAANLCNGSHIRCLWLFCWR